MRRYDLDALRVLAFLLLIVYHIGMFYVPWDWHAKSAHIIPELQMPMGLLDPWRLTLLFVISGAATRFMGAKLPQGKLAGERSRRLLVPLFFGIVFIVPPQSWVEVVEKAAYSGTFLEFWGRYLSFDQSFGLILPTYNHLWFVAYLWLYTMIAAGFWRFLPRLDRLTGATLAGFGLFIVPIGLFGFYRGFVFPGRGETHVVWDDLYAHLHYGTAFVLGLLLARNDGAWIRLAKARHFTLLALAILFLAGRPLSAIWEDQPDWRGQVFALIREGYAWLVICVLLGYAHHHIRKGSPTLTMLTEAVFPFYIIHQTTIILAGHALRPYGLTIASEAGLILFATMISCVVTYGLARAIPFLRLPLGLKPRSTSV